MAHREYRKIKMKKQKKIIVEEVDWIKIVLAILIGMMIGAMGFGIVTQLGLSNQFITNQKHDFLMNQSFVNGTQLGYIKGVYDTSQLVLDRGILPIFVEGNLRYINLTNDLNKMEVK